MIISASRRTDLPACYSDWFLNRVRERYVLVRNPMNPHSVSRVDLSPDAVDCIVFWTKNPTPMLDKLDALKDYPFYFQFTLTPYENDVETNLPPKFRLVEAFHRLAERIGPERVIWRYDPIFLNGRYSFTFHEEFFARLAEQLKGCTEKCTISFLDVYPKIKRQLAQLETGEVPTQQQRALAKRLAEIATQYGLKIDVCSEEGDFSEFGISRARCIDPALISRLLGFPVKAGKDKNQRPGCGCIASVDIGAYDTCRNGCRYCYANHSLEAVRRNSASYDPLSPLLCSRLCPEDTVRNRKAESLNPNQLSFFRP